MVVYLQKNGDIQEIGKDQNGHHNAQPIIQTDNERQFKVHDMIKAWPKYSKCNSAKKQYFLGVDN